MKGERTAGVRREAEESRKKGEGERSKKDVWGKKEGEEKRHCLKTKRFIKCKKNLKDRKR